MRDIVIVDLGAGNLRSVSQAAAHVSGGGVDGSGGHGSRGSRVRISAEPRVIASATHLILPGQGALGAWIDKLNANRELRAAVLGRLRDGPVLGICLGLQALYARSEEGDLPGLGLLAGTVKHLAGAHASRASNGDGDGDGETRGDSDGANKTPRLKIPHMGWNRVRQTRDHPLWHGVEDGARFYFVHSFYVASDAREEVAGEADYGVTFTAAARAPTCSPPSFTRKKVSNPA